MSTDERVERRSVSLSIPGRPEYLRLVRLAAADTGARADFSIEEVEDLRIAVDELTYALMGEEPTDETVTLLYAAAGGVVEIEGSRPVGDEQLIVSELSRSIIAAVVDEYEIVDRDGIRHFRLVKRSRP